MTEGAAPEVNVSVIVPFFNGRAHLARCVEALLRQTYPRERSEILLVDNNSTDGSGRLVQYRHQIRMLSETKQGAYAARNRGVAASRGAILAFTDADCIAAPDWLERLVGAVSRPGVELVLGGRQLNGRSRALTLAAAYEREQAEYIFAAGESALAFGYTNNMGVRRTLFEQCGPFLEVPRGADSAFVFRVMEHCSPRAVCYVPEARIQHLEISTLQRWLRKKILYGRAAEQMSGEGVRRHRRLTRAESREILWRTGQRNRYSRSQMLELRLIVATGMLCYNLGRLTARWST